MGFMDEESFDKCSLCEQEADFCDCVICEDCGEWSEHCLCEAARTRRTFQEIDLENEWIEDQLGF